MSGHKEPTDFGRAVGQYIGLLMERALGRLLAPFKPLERQRWADSHRLEHEIDFVIGTRKQPLIILDSKYIKGQRHAREKANEIVNMLLAIQESNKSVKLSIAVIAGNFTSGSIRILEDRGIKVFHIPLDVLAGNMRKKGLIIDWADEDRTTSKNTWQVYKNLSEKDLDKIADSFFDNTDIPKSLVKLIKESI